MQKSVIESMIHGWFEFEEYSSHKSKTDIFENRLDQFMDIEVYSDFEEFLLDNSYLLEDEDDPADVNKVIANQDNYSNFMDSFGYAGTIRSLLSYEQTSKPFIFALSNSSSSMYFLSLQDVRSKRDVFNFINEVLRAEGEVSHSTGTKNRYYVRKEVN